VLHVRAPMFTTARDGAVRNGYTLRFSNKSNETHKFAIEISGIKDAVAKSEETDTLPDGRLMVSVDPDSTQEIELYVTAPLSSATNAGAPITMKATDLQDGETVSVGDHFFGP
jgi:polyferredoxin